MITFAADATFAHGLARGRLDSCGSDGSRSQLPVRRWLGPATQADDSVLDRVSGPVLDVGCGPGRMLRALADRGIDALGVDTNHAAARIARRHGGHVVESSVFARLPRPGEWLTLLLLDGNIGIAGAPLSLLQRACELLVPGGRALVELDAPGVASGVETVRIESGGVTSAWFPWARVSDDAIATLAAEARLELRDRWTHSGRWFAELGRPPA